VKIVDVLCDQEKLTLEFVLKFGEITVCSIGPDFIGEQLASSLIIKLIDQLRITLETFRGGYLVNWVVFPEAIGGAECLYTRFGGDAGSGKYHD
jgi:hypothetical protein